MTKNIFKLNVFIVITLMSLVMIQVVNNTAFAESNFKSELTGITEDMLSPTYWQTSVKENKVIYSVKEILNKNKELFDNNLHMNQLRDFPKSLSNKNIHSQILKASKKPTTNRYLSNGKLISNNQWNEYTQSLNLNSLAANFKKVYKVKFGLVVKRTALRTFPTNDAVFKKSNEINLDRFQETALFPTEVVVVLHESLDSHWLFVSNYNYSAWVKKDDIAIGNREMIFDFHDTQNFLMITGDRVFTSYNPHKKIISQIQLDMGTKVPLVNEKNIPATLDGQNTYASYVVYLPTRDPLGQLKVEMALIPRNKDISVGYLSFNQNNIINQSFKFLGERYGWGHSFNARDCTGFVGDIYKSFGILMPRNSSQQANSEQGKNIHFSNSASRDEKLKEIRKLSPGDLIYIPGHVMIFLGLEENNPYIIHDVSGLSYYDKNGKYVQSNLNGVSVTPLLPLQLNAEKSYLDNIYSLKKLRK